MPLPFYLSSLLDRFLALIRWLWSRPPWLTGNSNSDFHDARLGEVLNSRFTLQCKLGGGQHSNTYLASYNDHHNEVRYVAIKILSRDATIQCNGDKKTVLELEVMRRIQEGGEFDTLPRFMDSFGIPERGTPAHICMVMHVLGSDVGRFRRSSPQKTLPHYTVRIIMRQVVDALAHLHSLGIVHTDVKPDNILFHTWMSAKEISAWVKRTFPFPAGTDLNASYPLPNFPDLTWDCAPDIAKCIKVALMDLGQAQWANRQPTVGQFSAFSLRAPEVVIQSDFTTAIDNWAVGCIVFEMLVGRWLFHPVDGGDDWTLEDDHLAKMMEFTGENFNSEMISRAYFGPRYFDDSGNLLRVTEMFPVTLENALANYGVLPSEEIQPAADFIRACIRLDPKDRPTARELLKHPWFEGCDDW